MTDCCCGDVLCLLVSGPEGEVRGGLDEAGGGCRSGILATFTLGVGGGLGPSMLAIASLAPRFFSKSFKKCLSTEYVG